jgi:hypothetical protein
MTFKFSIGDKVVYRNFRSIVSNYLFGTGAWTITERYRGWFRRNRYVCEGLYLGGSPGRVVVSESAICIAPRREFRGDEQ